MTTILYIPGTKPPNPFSTPIQAFLISSKISSAVAPAADKTAAHLVTTVTDASDPAHALWELWDAFFTSVVNISTSHAPHLALLDAFYSHPPTQPKNVPVGSDTDLMHPSISKGDGKLDWSKLPRFSAQWRDVHDILEDWRDWDGVRTSGEGDNSVTGTLNSSGDAYFLRFCVFSAALLKATKGKGGVHPIWVFYACRDVLESKGPQSHQPKAHRMPPEQVWALDVRVAATWMRDGGRALWETDHVELREYWGAALDDKRELWPREDGLTRERWQLWRERFQALSTDEGNLDQETRTVIKEAIETVEDLLGETST